MATTPSGFAVVCTSALVSPAAATAMAEACAIQWAQDIGPAWNLPPMTVRVCSALQVHPWEIVALVSDTVEVPADLGFHNDFPAPNIQIQASVILGSGPHDDATVLAQVAPILSHEIGEAGVDPLINLTIQVTDDLYAPVEIADPVQDNHYPVRCGDGTIVMVSDFVTPRYFDVNATRPAAFDKMGVVTAPLQIRAGYMVQYDAAGNATEVFGAKAPDNRVRLLSRRRRARLAWRPTIVP